MHCKLSDHSCMIHTSAVKAERTLSGILKRMGICKGHAPLCWRHWMPMDGVPWLQQVDRYDCSGWIVEHKNLSEAKIRQLPNHLIRPAESSNCWISHCWEGDTVRAASFNSHRPTPRSPEKINHGGETGPATGGTRWAASDPTAPSSSARRALSQNMPWPPKISPHCPTTLRP